MTMRSQGGYAYCDVCEMLFASGSWDKKGTITHPTAQSYSEMDHALIEKYSKCPDAGKTFMHPMMEEVTEVHDAEEG